MWRPLWRPTRPWRRGCRARCLHPPPRCASARARARWGLYTTAHLLERVLRRSTPTPAPAGSPPAAVLDAAAAGAANPLWRAVRPHLTWALPPVLAALWCVHGVWSATGVAALGPAAAALEVGPKERAMHLQKARAAKRAAAHAALSAPDADDGDSATLAGPSVGSLRAWLRQVRETLYQAVGAVAAAPVGLYGVSPPPASPDAWRAALADGLTVAAPRHVRLLERHVVMPLIKACPPAERGAWVGPMLVTLLPAAHTSLSTGWAAVTAATSGAARAEDDVVAERLLREFAHEHTTLLRALFDRPPVARVGVVPPATDPSTAAPRTPSPTPAGGPHAATADAGPSVFDFLLGAAPDAALAALATAAATLWWPDHEACARGAAVCRAAAPLLASSPDPRARELVARTMLRGALAALATPGAAAAAADALTLARDVLLAFPPVASDAYGSRAELLAVPGVTPAGVDGLAAHLASSRGDKDQRAAVKALLAASGGAMAAALSADANKPAGGAAGAAAGAAAAACGGRPRRGGGAPRQDEGPGGIGLAS